MRGTSLHAPKQTLPKDIHAGTAFTSVHARQWHDCVFRYTFEIPDSIDVVLTWFRRFGILQNEDPEDREIEQANNDNGKHTKFDAESIVVRLPTIRHSTCCGNVKFALRCCRRLRLFLLCILSMLLMLSQ